MNTKRSAWELERQYHCGRPSSLHYIYDAFDTTKQGHYGATELFHLTNAVRQFVDQHCQRQEMRPALESMFNKAATTKEGHMYPKDIQAMITSLSKNNREIMFVDCNDETANILVAALDEDQNGSIEMEEFVSWLISGMSKSKEHRMKFSERGEKFAMLIQFMESVMEVAKKMTNESGMIDDLEEMRPALESMYNKAATSHMYPKDIQNMITTLSEQHPEIMFVNCKDETANILVAALDEDQNGTIEMEEFVSWLISGMSKSKDHRLKFSKKGEKFSLLIQFMESVMEVAKKMTRDEMFNKSKESKRMDDDLEEMREDESSLGPKYIASNAEKRAACRAIFHQVDSDMSGYIDAEELVQLLTKLMDDLKLESINTQHEITLEEAEYFIDSMDSDGNMLIDCDEFVNFMVIGMSASNDQKIIFRERSSLHEKLALLIDGLSQVTEMRSHSLQAMYDKYEDKNAGGLTTDTLFQLFSEAHTDEVHRYDDVQQFFQIMDEDRNGAIDREEWCSYLLYGMSMPDEWRQQFGSKSPMHAKIAAVVRLCLLRTEELVLERTLLPITAARTSILKSVMS